MAQWDYHVAMATLEEGPGGVWEWRVYHNGAPYALNDVLQAFGRGGWELVSLNVEAYLHNKRSKRSDGYSSVEYPFEKTNAIEQRLVFKKALPS